MGIEQVRNSKQRGEKRRPRRPKPARNIRSLSQEVDTMSIDPDRVSDCVVRSTRTTDAARSRSLCPREGRSWDVSCHSVRSDRLVLGTGLLLLWCGLRRRGLRRRGLGGRGLGFGLGLRRTALRWLGFLHRHRSHLVLRHTRLRPTGMNRPVPAPIHTKSFNFWKTNFPGIGRISCRPTQSRPTLLAGTVENWHTSFELHKLCTYYILPR